VLILQTLPALLFGLFFNCFARRRCYWAAIGFAAGTMLAWVNG